MTDGPSLKKPAGTKTNYGYMIERVSIQIRFFFFFCDRDLGHN